VCDLETSRMGAPYIYIYIYDISRLRVKVKQKFKLVSGLISIQTEMCCGVRGHVRDI